MKFRKFKKILSQNELVQICLASIGDVDSLYQSSKFIPDKYNKFSVISVGIEYVRDPNVQFLKPAIMVYLDDIKSRKKEVTYKEDKK